MDRCRAQFHLKSNTISSGVSLLTVRSQSQSLGPRFLLRLPPPPPPHRLVHDNYNSFQSLQCYNKFCHIQSFARLKAPPRVVATARSESNEYESTSVGTPLEPQTPEGKFLCGMLKNHPHIFSVAASEQLEELATNRDNALARWERSADSSESCLHGRIAEMKELECQIAIEEVMYLMVVHNFYEIKVPLIPNLSKCITTDGRLEVWSSKIGELESIHDDAEILEMVREHVYNILRWNGGTTEEYMGENRCMIRIKRLQLGRVYAASIMYGYFLKSVRLRHHLELSLPPLMHHQTREENLVALRCYNNDTTSSSSSAIDAAEQEKLRRYMMSFDSKTLQICAKLRSREAANLIERHTWALFGYSADEKNDDIINGDIITVSASGLRRLVMEAVAFGCFLWEVERCVDSVYRLKEN